MPKSARLGTDRLVDDRRRSDDKVQVVLSLQPLLDDLHVQQAKEAAPASRRCDVAQNTSKEMILRDKVLCVHVEGFGGTRGRSQQNQRGGIHSPIRTR